MFCFLAVTAEQDIRANKSFFICNYSKHLKANSDVYTIWVCHSGGPPFQRSAIPQVRHERMQWGIGVWAR